MRRRLYAFYNVPLLIPGNYRVAVKMAGYDHDAERHGDGLRDIRDEASF